MLDVDAINSSGRSPCVVKGRVSDGDDVVPREDVDPQ